MANFSVRPIVEKEVWEAQVAPWSEANFLQSWNWGVFHESLGKKVFHLAFLQDEQVVGLALAVKEVARRGTYLTVAGGPLIDWRRVDLVEFVVAQLRVLAKQEHAVFVRFRPQALDEPDFRHLLRQHGVVEAPMHLTADLTLQLDLTQTEDELLAAMRKNTRYEVRRAERLQITVKESTEVADIKPFYEQQLALAQKHHFVAFGYDFLLNQFATFVADGQARLFHAYQGSELLASAFILFYHGEAVYHYGVSTPANDKLPGSYACQWAAIRWAKANGGLRYNFWGIAPEEKKEHRFAGVSLFKRGFGGTEVAYLPAQDIPVSRTYWIIQGFEKLRRRLRKLS